MPAALSVEKRREIIKRHEAGETLKVISEQMQLSYNTVKKIWSHWRKYQKVSPNYEQAKEKGTRKYRGVYEEAIEMKAAHVGWGAPLIHLKLSQQHPDKDLPSIRTLQRWFRQAGVSRSPKVRQRKETYVKRGQVAHEVWAMDAKEQMKLEDGSDASWLVVTDEASGAILDAQVFPPQDMDTS